MAHYLVTETTTYHYLIEAKTEEEAKSTWLQTMLIPVMSNTKEVVEAGSVAGLLDFWQEGNGCKHAVEDLMTIAARALEYGRE